MSGVYLVLCLLVLASPAMGAMKNEDCLECHENYKAYVHGSVSCADCHADVAELPHKEKLRKPSCEECHQATQALYVKSIHEKKGVACKECHAVHYINKEKKYCASCHADVPHKSLPVKDIQPVEKLHSHITQPRCST
ncbi:MAG TPA: cytochrome c3 family protein [Syntrophorhabdales bacterium]|nr:cytochrome c3 family protein [Syntrophorhabdales bacterium]